VAIRTEEWKPMTETRTASYYDTFYAEGGWQYDPAREKRWHQRHMVRRFGIPRGARMLEVACGMGLHTDLFCRMGFDCVGIDRCMTGIEAARAKYPQRAFHCADALAPLPFPEESFDVVVTRGCSLYHYDLQAAGPLQCTTNLMRYLKRGGRFVLIIVSDLSGRRDPIKIWQNRIEDYRQHFHRFDAGCTVNWHRGVVICGARRIG